MTTIQTQLCMNALPIPKELVEIIKEFLFHNIETISKRTKNRSVKMIMETMWTPYTCQSHPNILDGGWFFRTRDLRREQFGCRFCLQCGNYEYSYKIECKQIILCHC